MNEVTFSERLAQDAPETFEQYLLVALDCNEALWNKISKYLCHKKGQWHNDFDSLEHYAIYRALFMWRDMMTKGGVKFAPISEGGLASSLCQLSTSIVPPIISIDQVSAFTKDYLQIRSKVYAEEAVAAVKPAWQEWLTKKQVGAMLNECRRSGIENVDDTLSSIEQTKRDIAAASDQDADKLVWDISDLMSYEEEIIERMPLSTDFKNFNMCLGGGLGKKEHVLVIAPTGGGKTTFACQLAADLAMVGKGTLLISTEQHPQELLPKLLSNLSYKLGCKVPYGPIKDGITQKALRQLNKGQMETLKKAAVHLKSLKLVNWSIAGYSLDDLPRQLDEMQKKDADFKIDCVILDWIGGALTERARDPQHKKLLLDQAAATMKDIAIKYNISTVSLAQTSAKGIDVRKVTEQHIADSKTMHHLAVAGFGISALRIHTDDQDEEDAYQEKQYIYCFKSRKGKGKLFPITRNFDYQRFENV